MLATLILFNLVTIYQKHMGNIQNLMKNIVKNK
jgi:hypothetical protein